jgi:hypothetical protein
LSPAERNESVGRPHTHVHGMSAIAGMARSLQTSVRC